MFFRRVRVLLMTTGAAVLAVVLAGLPVYVRPQADPVRHADVIVVLGGTGSERIDIALELAAGGLAPEVLVSQSTGPDDPALDRYCAGRFAFRVACFVPQPSTVEGEAREVARRASVYGWRHVMVVTLAPYASRVRYVLGQCFDGELSVVAGRVNPGASFWARTYVRQTAGYVRAFVHPACPTPGQAAARLLQ
ncbi:YdcF family protein [Nocardia thailandica]